MAQSNEIVTTGATYLGIEVTPGITPTMVRVHPRRGGTRAETEATLTPDTLTGHVTTREDDVLGYKTCQSQMPFDARTVAARIDDAASPTRPWQGVPLVALLGGESIHAGSKIVAGTTTTVLNVTTSEGARFNVGDGILVTVAGVNEFAVIKSISGDALTLAFVLSGVPANGADVFACITYYPTEQNDKTLTFQHARGQNSASQWTHNMCTGSLSIETARDALLSFAISLKGGNWVGPSAQGIAATEASQTMSAPVANVRAFQLLQPVSTTTRTHVPFESIAFSLDVGMNHVLDTGGPTEGLLGAMRTAFSAGADVTVRHDAAWRTSWTPSTVYQLVHCVYTGAGASRGCVAIVMFGTLSETPGYEAGSNNRGVTKLKFKAKGAALSSDDDDQARAPFLWMMG